MRNPIILIGSVLMTFAGLASAHAQQPNPIQGTPGSLFPYAAPNEVQMINGVRAGPCSSRAATCVLL